MMCITDATHSRATETSAAGRLAARFKAGWQTYLLRRRLKATVFTLQGLDDRTLSDIGLDRSEIESVVRSKSHERRQRMIEFGGVVARG
ncbi:MAG: DUF1127 domain-containing protein [Hyphomicrobiaceae bacterium]